MSESYKMPLSWNDMRMVDLYKKRDSMFHQIGLMLEDCQLMHEIGNRTWVEFQINVLNPMAQIFRPNEPVEVWKYRGVHVSLIRYYCDVFNTKVEHDNQ